VDNFLPTILSIFYKFFPELKPDEPVKDDTFETGNSAYEDMLDAVIELLDEGQQAWTMKRVLSFTTDIAHHEKPITLSAIIFDRGKDADCVTINIKGSKLAELHGYGTVKENSIVKKTTQLIRLREKMTKDKGYASAAEAIKRS
jgi:hypothetical protein